MSQPSPGPIYDKPWAQQLIHQIQYLIELTLGRRRKITVACSSPKRRWRDPIVDCLGAIIAALYASYSPGMEKVVLIILTC